MNSTPELWKPLPIEGYADRYEVSNCGRVRNSLSQVGLKPGTQSSGYLTVSLHPRPQRSFLVHRLVALAFLPKPVSERRQVNHIDGNKRNNVMTNLEWVTPVENNRHAIKTGLTPKQKGHESVNAKLTADQVRAIRSHSYSHGLFARLGREFGISEKTARQVYIKRTYTEI